MKNSLILSIILVAFSFSRINAQVKLDTIYANDIKNVALFFPEPIQQGIAGSDNFILTYNREKEQTFALLQATPGKESNLLFISNSGAVFSYIVKYSEELQNLNYFIEKSGSIGNVNRVVVDSGNVKIETDLPLNAEIKPSLNDRLYLDKFSSYLLNKSSKSAKLRKRNEKVVLKLENIVFHNEHLYFVMEIQNRSAIDYEVNFLKVSVKTRKNGKKKSMQNLNMDPVFKYEMPDKIGVGETARFVYVMPKFSIADDKLVMLDLNERNGERNMKLKIKQRFVNNPN
ncbi:DUF4138 domain-containing protein [Christiangramia sediminis]|uniref:DUF4138 domain-containing protein n=1 Tax=Christiangramia sediminis TaxID=2881336 RepID=A0A9X1LH67_9FLAO|nr:DUF4138 domain-containing protein [Christiangramia sediminis]MCB7480285.1 DUF4138 domain-containing protein [Christiangramia sediminis]